MNSRVLPAIALLIAIGIFFSYVDPTWTGAIAETKTKIAADDQALEAANRFIEQENQLAQARSAIDPTNLARLTTFLPDSVDNVGLILDLNALAASTGLSLSSIDITANDTTAALASANIGATGMPVSPLNSVDLSLSAIGTYPALKSFLSGIEKSLRLLDVQTLDIKGSDTGVYGYQMKLRIHWLR